MTIPEASIVAGNGSNSNNRYGDYAAMSIDPADDSTFWFTGEYNPTSTWATRIAHIQLDDACNGLTAITNHAGLITCPGDSNAAISIHAIGGLSGNYQYSLDNTTFQASNNFTNLPPGNFVVYVQDGSCVSQVSVTIAGPDTFAVDKFITDVTCFGLNDGRISVNATGGTPPLEYSVDNTNWSTNSQINSLSAGNYTVYIRDNHNCTTEIDSIEIIEPTELIVVDSIIAATSSTSTDGSIYLNVTGGSPIYYYSLDSISFKVSNFFNNLAAGNYTTYVVDLKGCVVVTEVHLHTVSVNELFSDNNLVVFPNPTNGRFSVKIGSDVIKYGAEITVRDVSGKLIFSTLIDPKANDFTQEIDLSKNAKGIYLVAITANQESKTIKVILK